MWLESFREFWVSCIYNSYVRQRAPVYAMENLMNQQKENDYYLTDKYANRQNLIYDTSIFHEEEEFSIFS
jgi:hypothetical protein